MLKEKFSNMLESKRVELGFSYKDMAQYLSVSYLQLHRWISKKNTPRAESLRDCCERCGVDYLTLTSAGHDTYSLDLLTLDTTCRSYKHTQSIISRHKCFVLCASLLYQEITQRHSFAVNMFISELDDPDLKALRVVEVSCIISSKAFGKLTVIPTASGINFKYQKPGSSPDTPTGISPGFEVLSSNAISRIAELIRLTTSYHD
mgnify:CR=1 FL=1